MAGVEIERKYVIVKPLFSDMESSLNYSSSSITQTYLESLQGITHRVRKREYRDGKTVYTETVKRRIDRLSSYEDEREITEEEYNTLLLKIKKGTRSLTKDRHVFTFLGKIFEIDIYPEWEGACIMETELSSREQTVEMPSFIRIIEEVTGRREYSNAAMSHTFPDEPKVK